MRLPEKPPEPEWNREEVLQHLEEQKKAKEGEEPKEGSFEKAFGKGLSGVGKATTEKTHNVFADAKTGERRWGPESKPREGIKELEERNESRILKESPKDPIEKLGFRPEQQKIIDKVLQGGEGKEIRQNPEGYKAKEGDVSID